MGNMMDSGYEEESHMESTDNTSTNKKISMVPVCNNTKTPPAISRKIDNRTTILGKSTNFVRTQGDGKESDEEDLIVKENVTTMLKVHGKCRSVNGVKTKIQKIPPVHHMSLNENIIRVPNVTFNTEMSREPQFVPYEPYKCAIKPLEKKSSSVQKSQRSSKEHTPNRKISPPIIIDAVFNPTTAWQEENELLRNELKLQVQVNGELKRMLIASVGEDVEARVAFLTQDKALLANHLRWYAEQLTNNGEESDQLKIEGDIWRSKFLASSLLVGELAQSRGEMVQKIRSASTVITMLLEERSIIQKDLSQTLQHLQVLQESTHSITLTDNAHSTIQLASVIHNLTYKLAKEIDSDMQTSDCSTYQSCFTPGEIAAKQFLDGSSYSSKSSDLCPCGSGHRLGPPPPAIQCCSHCSGEVHSV